MGLRSQYEHLKPKVFSLFRKGLKPSEVCDRMQKIPKSTIYDWHKDFRNRNPKNDENQSEKAIEVEVIPEEVPNSSPKLVALPSGEESDYQLARRTVRSILRDSEVNPHTRVMAVGALAKLIEMRYNLPAHILDETTKTSLDDERDRVRGQSAEDLARLYREAL